MLLAKIKIPTIPGSPPHLQVGWWNWLEPNMPGTFLLFGKQSDSQREEYECDIGEE